MESGLIFNVQKYSVHDGPGIRTTVFFKGCPLRCQWCHNPEGISPRREIIVVESRCLTCGECREACPMTGSGANDGALQSCQMCGACVEACPTGARQMAGAKMTEREVMIEVLKDRIFYDQSGGGVTFSGGEPLMQPRFLLALLSACQREGIHAAVDTCGVANPEHLMECAKLANLFLFDLKLMDDARHREYTGVSNAIILENLKALAKVHPAIWIRIPIIPGVNDDAENLTATALLIADILSVRQVNLLPYHNTGAQKFERLGQPCQLKNVVPPSMERMEQIRALFSKHGVAAQIGG